MTRSTLSKELSLGLKAGDWVVVRSAEEILATLDADCRLDGLLVQGSQLVVVGGQPVDDLHRGQLLLQGRVGGLGAAVLAAAGEESECHVRSPTS